MVLPDLCSWGGKEDEEAELVEEEVEGKDGVGDQSMSGAGVTSCPAVREVEL